MDELMLDTRGIPSDTCLCGGKIFKILAQFEGDEISWYTSSGYCFECGAAISVPLPPNEH